MLTPELSVQAAVRDVLIASPAIREIVTPNKIIAGSLDLGGHRWGIIVGPVDLRLTGYAAGRQTCAEISLTVHTTVTADATEDAQRLAGLVARALMDAPAAKGLSFDEWQRPVTTTYRAGDSIRTAIDLRAHIRWMENDE